jgi:hypothetical protein
MGNVLKTGSDWLAGMFRDHAADAVTYTRPGEGSATVRATRGSSEFPAADVAGVELTYRSDDWIIAVGQLVLGGVAIQPAAGDQITAGGETYEVMAVEGQQAWRWCDAHHNACRIHTKRIG